MSRPFAMPLLVGGYDVVLSVAEVVTDKYARLLRVEDPYHFSKLGGLIIVAGILALVTAGIVDVVGHDVAGRNRLQRCE